MTSFQHDSCKEKHKSTAQSNMYFVSENYITKNKDGDTSVDSEEIHHILQSRILCNSLQFLSLSDLIPLV
jgi:hypothetical protein